MTDMTGTIIAKSDQLNSDDLIGRKITIKITKVSLLAGEQPISIHYEGDEGKPWKPCKSMRRVLVGVWGNDGKSYIDRYLTLYRDDSVIFGGQAVGGIRISHMSNIEKSVTMSLTATKKSKKPFTVLPLAIEEKKNPSLEQWVEDIKAAPTLDGLEYIFKEAAKVFKGDERTQLISAKDARKLELVPATQDTGERA